MTPTTISSKKTDTAVIKHVRSITPALNISVYSFKINVKAIISTTGDDKTNMLAVVDMMIKMLTVAVIPAPAFMMIIDMIIVITLIVSAAKIHYGDYGSNE